MTCAIATNPLGDLIVATQPAATAKAITTRLMRGFGAMLTAAVPLMFVFCAVTLGLSATMTAATTTAVMAATITVTATATASAAVSTTATTATAVVTATATTAATVVTTTAVVTAALFCSVCRADQSGSRQSGDVFENEE